MQLHTFTKNLSDEEKQIFDSYLDEKLPKFEKLLGEFDPDGVKLDAKAEKFVSNEAFKVNFVIEIPRVGVLRSEEDSRDLRGGIDSCERKLIEQVKRHMEKLHNEHQHAS